MKLKSENGITLMELMIVVVIIGIIGAMAVPRFQIAVDRMNYRTTARKVTSTLRSARSNAISQKVPYGIYIDGSAMTITTFKDIVNPSTHVYDSGDSTVSVDTLPSDYYYLGTDVTNNVIFFEQNGSSFFVGGGNIVSAASSDVVVAIAQHNILSSTGRIKTDSWVY